MAFVFCTLIFYLRGENYHLQITWTVSSDVRRLCFIIIVDVVSHPFALWKDTLLPFVNLKLIYFVFSKWENSILCCAFVSCLFIYNLNELFTFHGMVMPIFIIIYCFKINFQGNKRSFASFLCVTCLLLNPGEASQALLITNSYMWIHFKHNSTIRLNAAPSICLLERKKNAYLTALLVIQAENTHKGQVNRWRLLCVALLIVPAFVHGRLRNIPLSHTVMDNSQRSRSLSLRPGRAVNEMQGHFSHQGSFVRRLSLFLTTSVC